MNQNNDNMIGPTRALGMERWVQFGFIVAALGLFWVLDHVVWSIWDLWAEPSSVLVTTTAALVSIAVVWSGYQVPRYRSFIQEVAGELSRVTWPSRQETWSHTVVVVIVSLIAAVILGIFDAAWSAITDLIYSRA
ncbi:MAG: preprotein translocase subunit SecE [Myxococcota bacterium]